MPKVLKNRIFTQTILFTQVVPGGAADYEYLSQDSMLAQEDILVVGFDLRCAFEDPGTLATGTQLAQVQLSQAGEFDAPGMIASLSIGGYNNAANFTSVISLNEKCMTFPDGDAIPVKEDGHLYLHASARQGTVVDFTFAGKATIWYIKGTARA